nr:hypothetical protein [Kibdelosporangium sp. MJ126-NF4]CEL23319.1 hypothetical protein [Kibdelosporangium sp. MJ126-NF4]CTQ94481.1 hypothetical protein [Kibdelosporangium sp. MJ126-NF4]
MHVVGFWLKAIGVLAGAFGLARLGFDAENGYLDGGSWIATVFVESVAAGLAWLGSRWHRSESVRDLDVARRPGTRPFRPGLRPHWLPHEAWPEFPDPLPEVPDVTGEPEIDIPVGGVPPDHTLRRLWLVRAQLAAHLDKPTARARRNFPGAGALAVSSVLLAGFAGLALVGAQAPSGVLGPMLACGFLLIPFGWTLFTYTLGFSLVARRRHALQEAQARLTTMDNKRPGGPLGGPPVRPGELPYVPPSIPPGRLPST